MTWCRMMKYVKGFVRQSFKFHDSTSFLLRGSIRKGEGCANYVYWSNTIQNDSYNCSFNPTYIVIKTIKC